MSETYKIHFGSSKSKYYSQAVKLAELAYKHEIHADGEDSWHIAILTEEQVNLMGFLYEISQHLPWARQYDENGTDRYPLIEKDMSRVYEKLKSEGYIDYYGPGFTYVMATKIPSEPIPEYRHIRELVFEGKFKQAVKVYYSTLDQVYYDELVEESIYLKRLANIPLTGRDILYFRTPSSRKGLIEENLSEYVECIDAALFRCKKQGYQSPIEIIIEYAPTLEQLIERTRREWNQEVVTVNDFDARTCPKGRLFDRYPDQVLHCRVNEFREDWDKLTGLWTTCSPAVYQREILDQDLYLTEIEICYHRQWKDWNRIDFTTVKSKDKITRKQESARRIKYTGRTHIVDGETFYEIAIAWYEQVSTDEIENPFVELVSEVLREAENLLRENHGLPKIGEGWISETKLYYLVQEMYPDTQQHASPDWIKPQHLDVFIPSQNIAFEYQGRQHFEPVDFFGGKEAFEKTKKRDKRKRQKCEANGIRLIYWHYEEAIDQQILVQKLDSKR